jgi:hypothetical protein
MYCTVLDHGSVNTPGPGPSCSDKDACVRERGRCPTPDPAPLDSPGGFSVEVQQAWRKPRDGRFLFMRDVLLQDPVINRVRMLCLIHCELCADVSPFFFLCVSRCFSIQVTPCTYMFIFLWLYVFSFRKYITAVSIACIDALSTSMKIPPRPEEVQRGWVDQSWTKMFFFSMYTPSEASSSPGNYWLVYSI